MSKRMTVGLLALVAMGLFALTAESQPPDGKEKGQRGGQHAAASVYPLLRALFGLEGQWPPYHDQLEARLPDLERLQGWRHGELHTQIVALLDHGSPAVQQRLQAGVEALFRSRGIEHEWGDDLEELKRLQF